MKTEKISVELIDHMGSDLTVCNAARVSFDKQHSAIEKSDYGLIKYLAKHNHFTPYTHCQLQFRITAPIFVARQAFKHKVGLSENEISRRYVDAEPSFFLPKEWRERAEDKKQGSSDKTVPVLNEQMYKIAENGVDLEEAEVIQHNTEEWVYETYDLCLRAYNLLLANNVSPEQARMVLPQGMITSWFWTGSLFAFSRVYNLRSSPDAQKEIQDMAKLIGDFAKELYPISWESLIND